MRRSLSPRNRLRLILLLACATLSSAPGPGPARLPKPRMDGGRPLMEVLRDRKTTRTFSDKPVPAEVLANLLWAANGVNRPELGKRTAPSAMDSQEIDVYMAMADGLYLYEPKQAALTLIVNEDVRSKAGGAEFVKKAPISLIYVADFARMKKTTEELRQFYTAIDTGFVSQNVYLFCACEGLGTVVHDEVDRKVLPQIMKLRPEQKIMLGQCVGYPE